jgi:hypothetical protein
MQALADRPTMTSGADSHGQPAMRSRARKWLVHNHTSTSAETASVHTQRNTSCQAAMRSVLGRTISYISPETQHQPWLIWCSSPSGRT